MEVRLNKKQFEYLSHNFIEDHPSLNLKVTQGNEFTVINLNEDIADEIRDWAGEELQEKGFDENYEPNKEGEILENLIDIFYIG